MKITSRRVFAIFLGICISWSFCAEKPAKSADIHLKAPESWKYDIKRDLVPAGKFARKLMEPMSPEYVTIHSTQNFSSGADALAHARGQREGSFKSEHNRLGYLAWHFTVDDTHTVQSLPCNERGQHADYEGLGNQLSIGIEMCEHPDNNRAQTLQRTAKLCALLMVEYRIPLYHVLPHQHWERIRHSDQKNIGHKNCPHFLLGNGKPGEKWQAFLNHVLQYYKQHPQYDASLGKLTRPDQIVDKNAATSIPSKPEGDIELPSDWIPGEKPTKEPKAK